MDKVVFVQCECKDCKKASDRTQGAQEIFLCNQFRRLVSGNFFCKSAERKEDEKQGKRYFLSYDEAVDVLPNEEYVHTFINNAIGLIGADWEKHEVLHKLKTQILSNCAENRREKWGMVFAVTTNLQNVNPIYCLSQQMKTNY